MKKSILFLWLLSCFGILHAQDVTLMYADKDSAVYLVRECMYAIDKDSATERLYYFYKTVWVEIYFSPQYESQASDTLCRSSIVNLACNDNMLMIQYEGEKMVSFSGIFLTHDGFPDWPVIKDQENMLRK